MQSFTTQRLRLKVKVTELAGSGNLQIEAAHWQAVAVSARD